MAVYLPNLCPMTKTCIQDGCHILKWDPAGNIHCVSKKKTLNQFSLSKAFFFFFFFFLFLCRSGPSLSFFVFPMLSFLLNFSFFTGGSVSSFLPYDYTKVKYLKSDAKQNWCWSKSPSCDVWPWLNLVER